jgi:hypothetical protein
MWLSHSSHHWFSCLLAYHSHVMLCQTQLCCMLYCSPSDLRKVCLRCRWNCKNYIFVRINYRLLLGIFIIYLLIDPFHRTVGLAPAVSCTNFRVYLISRSNLRSFHFRCPRLCLMLDKHFYICTFWSRSTGTLR